MNEIHQGKKYLAEFMSGIAVWTLSS